MFTVPSELHILKKEQFNNWYKLSTYYAAFLLTNIPVQVILLFYLFYLYYTFTFQYMNKYTLYLYMLTVDQTMS